MKQEFRIMDHFVQEASPNTSSNFPEDVDCKYPESLIVGRSTVAAFRRHPVTVYLKCMLALFVLLSGQRPAPVSAVQLSAIPRLAKNERKDAQKCSKLFKLIKTTEKMNLMSSSRVCVRLTKSWIKSKILCKNISEIWELIYCFGRQRSTNQQKMVPFGYVILGCKMHVQ